MVTRFILLFFFSPLFIFSGEFTASVNRNPVSLLEGFTLTLTLKDASAKDTPYIEPLARSFHMNSQQQFNNMSYINGTMSSTTAWKFVLIPLDEGEVIIPSLSIETSEGTLTTQPITLQVVKGKTASKEDSRDEGIAIDTLVSNPQPYKNEPFFYTIRLISQQVMGNIQAQKLQVEDAVVEIESQPKVYESMVGAARLKIIEFAYLITPLKAGPLVIPSHIVQGSVSAMQQSKNRQFFDDDSNPFFMMHGFQKMNPFALATAPTVVEVLPAIPEITPWLPAKSLRIEEVWDEGQPLQVGEFFTRTFNIEGEGISSNQLPNLSDYQVKGDEFKIYADKPEMHDEVREGRVFSSRKESYTMIPQHSGSAKLPEISVTWWDVEKKQKVTRIIPARTLMILPAKENERATQEIALRDEIKPRENQEESLSFETSVNLVLYVIIAVLGTLLLIAFVWMILLQRKMARLLVPQNGMDIKKPEPPSKPILESKKKVLLKDKQEKLSDLNPT